jgi:hypothetical protein
MNSDKNTPQKGCFHDRIPKKEKAPGFCNPEGSYMEFFHFPSFFLNAAVSNGMKVNKSPTTPKYATWKNHSTCRTFAFCAKYSLWFTTSQAENL